MFCRKTFYSKTEEIHHETSKVTYGILMVYNKVTYGDLWSLKVTYGIQQTFISQ